MITSLLLAGSMALSPWSASVLQSRPGANCQRVEIQSMRITTCVGRRTPPVTTLRAAASTAASPRCGDIEMGLCSLDAVPARMFAAVPLFRAAKERGVFRDLGHCEEIAGRDTVQLAGIVGRHLANLVVGTCGECACRLAF